MSDHNDEAVAGGDRHDLELTYLHRATALALWRHDAVRVQPSEPFRLASGNHSPLYVNCRQVISSPGFMRLFVTAAAALIQRRAVDCDVIAGGETAGIPYAAYLASALDLPMAYLRKKPKGHGIASQVEGRIEPGTRVLLVEDLITDGGSKLGFLDAVAAVGGEIRHALVLFDRQQGGAALLAQHGVSLHAVTDLTLALDAGTASGALSVEARRVVDVYLADPAAWHEARGLSYQAG